MYAAGDLSDPHGTHRVCLNAIFRAAHSLKSNSLAFGASALAAIAREHELAGVERSQPLAALEAEYGRVAKRLGELRNA